MNRVQEKALDLPLHLVDEEGEPIPQSHAALFEKWRPEIEAVPLDALRPVNAEASLARANAILIEKRLEHLRPQIEALRDTNVRLALGLGEIAAAAVWANALYRNANSLSSAPIAPRLRVLRRWRQLLLGLAQAASVKGVVPEESVAKIARGRGPIDAVEDVISLVELLRNERRLVSEQGLITPAELKEIEATALEVDALVKPSAALVDNRLDDAQKEALRVRRARCWTLLFLAHEQLYLAVATLIGQKEARRLIPSLLSRRGLSASAQKAEPAPEVEAG